MDNDHELVEDVEAQTLIELIKFLNPFDMGSMMVPQNVFHQNAYKDEDETW